MYGGGYGRPPPQYGGGYGQPQYGAPPPQQYGYGAPPQGYGAPPPPQYGQGAYGYGAPKVPTGKIEDVKSLWLGEVQPDWTEEYVRSIYAECGKRFNVKLLRDRATGQSQGYGFLEFESHKDAEEVLNLYRDKPIPGTPFKCALKWGGGHGNKPAANSEWRAHTPAGYSGPPVQTDFSIFVGDLDYNVTEETLHNTFAKKYQSIISTKLVVDMSTGLSKGFAFIKFSSSNDRDKAMNEMHGQYVGERAIRVTLATTREEREREAKMRGEQQFYDPSRVHAPRATEEGENTCVFVGGLDESVSPDMLRHHFGLLGDIAYIRIPPGRGCGFVGFVHRKNAEAAISTLQGLRINGYKVRLSWGSMRQGPKNARVAQQAAAARAAALAGKPLTSQARELLGQTAGGILPMVTQIKKERKTPFGTLTNDYVEKLPEPRQPWPPPPSAAQPAVQPPPLPPKKATVSVPVSPYVAQLKARYDAYNAAGGKPAPVKATSEAERAPGSAFSLASRRSERPAKAPRLTGDLLDEENRLYAANVLKPSLLSLSAAFLAVPRPTPAVDASDPVKATPMETFLAKEAAAK